MPPSGFPASGRPRNRTMYPIGNMDVLHLCMIVFCHVCLTVALANGIGAQGSLSWHVDSLVGGPGRAGASCGIGYDRCCGTAQLD